MYANIMQVNTGVISVKI